MSATLPEGVQLVTPGDLGDELASFLRAMRASNVSPNTITAYGGAVRQFGLWLLDNDYPTDLAAIERRHVEDWINSILEHRKPATAHNRFRGLQRFFNWYETKDDDFVSPMRKLRPPRLPKLMPRVLTFDEIRAVLGTCQGGSFEDKRDEPAIGTRRQVVSQDIVARLAAADPYERARIAAQLVPKYADQLDALVGRCWRPFAAGGPRAAARHTRAQTRQRPMLPRLRHVGMRA